MIDMGFPDKLAALRKKKGLTQQALADDVGVHVVQIRRYEGGKTQPTLDIIRRLAISLSVSADELIFDKEERGPGEELQLQFEAVSRLGPQELFLVRELLDSIITRHDARRLFDRAAGDKAHP